MDHYRWRITATFSLAQRSKYTWCPKIDNLFYQHCDTAGYAFTMDILMTSILSKSPEIWVVSLRLQAHGMAGMSNYLSQPHHSYTEINPAKYNLLDIKQGGQQTYELEIVIASHTAAVVSWLNIQVNYSPAQRLPAAWFHYHRCIIASSRAWRKLLQLC